MELISLTFGAFIVVAAVISVRLLEGRGAFSRAFDSMVRMTPWILLLSAAVLGNWTFNRMGWSSSPFLLDQSATWADAFLQGLQGALQNDITLSVFSFVYLAMLPILLIAVPLTLLSEGSGENFRAYCIALFLSVAGLFLCHLLIQSPRPALTPGSEVRALLYGDPFWGNISLDLGSRGNSFPSGHTTMITAILVTLIARPRARLFLLSVLVMVILGVMYLGLHWPLDVVAGLVLGTLAGAVGWWLSSRLHDPLDNERPRSPARG